MKSTEQCATGNSDLEGEEMLWTQFVHRYPTEADRIEGLYDRLGIGNHCRYCRSTNIKRAKGSRSLKCNQCKKITWITATSGFKKKKELGSWFAAIWMIERGASLSSCKLASLGEIAQSSAYDLLMEIDSVLLENFDHSTHCVSSAQFKALFSRRSRETQARCHPSTEQDYAENKANEANQSDRTDQQESQIDAKTAVEKTFSEIERAIINALPSHPSSMSISEIEKATNQKTSEVLTSLTILELSGLIACHPGNRFSLGQSTQARRSIACGETSPKIEQTIKACCSYIGSVHKGISRKQLQLYIASFWCHIDPGRWKDKLLEAFYKSEPIKRDTIRNFVTELLVTMVVPTN